MLDRVSTDVLLVVIDFVPKIDLLALRLVSRRLRSASFTAFAKSWFTTIPLDFSKHRLEKLRAISDREDFRGVVRKLRIELIIGDSGGTNAVRAEPQWWTRDHYGLIGMSSPAIDVIRDCITNRLTSCKSFEVFSRGGPDVYYQRMGRTTSLEASDGVNILFYVLHEPGFPVQSLHINLGKTRLNTDVLCPKSRKAIASGGVWWLSNLQELHLSWALSDDEGYQMAISMITGAKNLRRLRFNWALSHLAHRFFSDLRFARESLPAIKHLFLSNLVNVPVTLLSSVLSIFRESLVSLKLYGIHLDEEGSWRSLLASLRDGCPCLEYIALADCSQGVEGEMVLFCPLRSHNPEVLQGHGEFELLDSVFIQGKINRVSGVRYIDPSGGGGGCGGGRGLGMKLALDAMVESIYSLPFIGGPPSPGYLVRECDVADRVISFRQTTYDF